MKKGVYGFFLYMTKLLGQSMEIGPKPELQRGFSLSFSLCNVKGPCVACQLKCRDKLLCLHARDRMCGEHVSGVDNSAQSRVFLIRLLSRPQ
jgi:hypothetical protein